MKPLFPSLFRALLTLCFLYGMLPANAQPQDRKVIEILGADRLIYNQQYRDAQRLVGNVRIRHQGMLMFCDSAQLYSEQNYLLAYGHIHVKQGDTLNIYGDSLYYDGNSRSGKLRGKVRMVERDLRLETDSLNFDVGVGTASYSNWGTLTSIKNQNVLRSKAGIYHSASKSVFFKDSVTLTHPDYEMRGDTLKYLTTTETAIFEGPTFIYTKESTIYSEKGWYDTRHDRTLFHQNARITRKENTLSGDTVYYDRIKGVGEAYGNISLNDTLNDFIINGDYGIVYELDERSLVTGKALFTKILEKDSLYLHADTLLATKDKELEKQVIFAFHHVKFFKTDLQGYCDSLVYDERDSSLKMYGAPVLWNEENQLTADYIQLNTAHGKPDYLLLQDNAFIVSEADSVGYNQIKGRTMEGRFIEDELRKVFVNGNGQTVYYGGEKGKPYVGMNKTVCSDILIHLENQKISRITFMTDPDAVLYPMHKINPKDKILDGFRWIPEQRPLSKEDIFKR